MQPYCTVYWVSNYLGISSLLSPLKVFCTEPEKDIPFMKGIYKVSSKMAHVWNEKDTCLCEQNSLRNASSSLFFVHIFTKCVEKNTHTQQHTSMWWSRRPACALNIVWSRGLAPPSSLEQWVMRVSAQVKWPGRRPVVQTAGQPITVAKERNGSTAPRIHPSHARIHCALQTQLGR